MFHLLEAEHAVAAFAKSDSNDRGAIFTKRSVAEFVLDLGGYSEKRDLAKCRLLEPSAGAGDFLLPAIERLIRSHKSHAGSLRGVAQALADSIRAYEIHADSFDAARSTVVHSLTSEGIKSSAAEELADRWLIHGDFLTSSLPHDFTHVVGNPPYVRQELIPEALLRIYRGMFQTLYDRADLYVLFYEKGLTALAPDGQLGFICADRWTKNKYGGPLRKMISDGYALTHYIDLTGSPAFHVDVDAYPAITIIGRISKPGSQTKVAYRPTITSRSLKTLARAMLSGVATKQTDVATFSNVVRGSEPWLLHNPTRLKIIRRLEKLFPPIEATGCSIGIGVATGADSVYVRPFVDLDVEPSRKLPLAMVKDTLTGSLKWHGAGVLNPFEDDGRLVDLKKYPKFAQYLDEHAAAVRARHVARKNEAGWYRTIDRITPKLASTPKLLIPDIKGDACVVFEEGRLYPHHNLYFITSDAWELRALQAVLTSGLARMFVGAYSTSMRGGFLRFQAQYLRRIRLPQWADVDLSLRRVLTKAGIAGDIDAARAATCRLYGLSSREGEELKA